MWATSSRCGRRRPQAEVGTQTDPPTPPVSPARAPAAPPTITRRIRFSNASDGLTHAQREEWADACAAATRWVDYRRRERLEQRWREQAAERGVVAHTTAPTAHRSAQRVVLEARAVLLADQLRRRASGAAAEGEAQTTASAAHRSAQRAVQEATRREELRRRGELVLSEADDHCEYEEYPPCENPRGHSHTPPRRRGRSRSRSEARRDQGILRDCGVA